MFCGKHIKWSKESFHNNDNPIFKNKRISISHFPNENSNEFHFHFRFWIFVFGFHIYIFVSFSTSEAIDKIHLINWIK